MSLLICLGSSKQAAIGQNSPRGILGLSLTTNTVTPKTLSFVHTVYNELPLPKPFLFIICLSSVIIRV